MDVHVPFAITAGLRLRGVDVLTAQAAGTAMFADGDLLTHATQEDRVLFSQDSDLIREATIRQIAGLPFSGVIYCHQQFATIGQCIEDLELICHVLKQDALANSVLYLPLR